MACHQNQGSGNNNNFMAKQPYEDPKLQAECGLKSIFRREPNNQYLCSALQFPSLFCLSIQELWLQICKLPIFSLIFLLYLF